MHHNIDIILTLTGGLAFGLLFGLISHRLGFSPILGYLLAGVAVGPFTPGLVVNQEVAMQFAEIGVILLMFGVGLHFHFKDLWAVRHVAGWGALAQIVAATSCGVLGGYLLGWEWSGGLLFGISISVASTVVLTRVLAEHQHLYSTSGRIAIGWLIVEDLFTILVLVLLPALAMQGGESAGWGQAIGWTILKLIAFVVVTLLLGRFAIPLLLDFVANTRSRELFTLCVLTLAIGIAVAAAQFFSVSMALGAFLAGMVVGRSPYGVRAASDALPMKDAFAVLFFVSVGMLFNPQTLWNDWKLLALTVVIVLVAKPIAALLLVRLLKQPAKIGVRVAVALAQIGEFSFLLATLAIQQGLLSQGAFDAIVATSIISITLNPFLYKAVLKREKINSTHQMNTEDRDDIAEKDTVLLVGCGPVGKRLLQNLKQSGHRVSVVEMNPETVKVLVAEGVPAIYGDATHPETLDKAGLNRCLSVIFSTSIPDVDEVIRYVKSRFPATQVIVRASYPEERKRFESCGADAVFVADDEMARVMSEYVGQHITALPLSNK